MKRGLLVFGGIIIIAMIMSSHFKGPQFDKFNCIVQSDKVVINSYIKDKIVRSVSISDTKVLTWEQGMKSPYYRQYEELIKDRGPTTESGEVPLKIYADSQIILWGEIVSKDCYDAI